MAIVNPVRNNLQQEDVAYRRSVSEGILTTFAEEANFINAFQTDIKEFKLNGHYFVTPATFLTDGMVSFFYNTEIVGVNFFIGSPGVSGVTEFDLRYLDVNGVDQGSIFSTTPKIDSTASNLARGFINLETSFVSTPTGVTAPVFSKTNFLQGENLYLVLNQAMSGGFTAGLNLHYRPIN